MDTKPTTKINFTITDSLRGLASLYVCIAHCRGVLWIGGKEYVKLHPYATWHSKDYLTMFIMSLTKASGEAVMFFFVLSGFSIAHSLTYQPKFIPFMYKRLVRLYPPYILGFLLAIVTVLVLKTAPAIFFSGKYDTVLFQTINSSLLLLTPATIIKTLLYWPNINTITAPYWSLVYEIFFYLGAIFFVRKLKTYYIVSSVLFIAGYFIGNFLPAYLANPAITTFIFQYNFYFMAGVFTYHNIDKINNWRWIVNKYWWALSLFAYFLMIVLESTIGEAYHIAFILAAITCIVMLLNMLSKNIIIKPLIQIGRFSYTLYMVNFPIIFLLVYCIFVFQHVPLPYIYSFYYWVPAVFICVGISYLFYLLVEKKTKKYLDKLRSKEAI